MACVPATPIQFELPYRRSLARPTAATQFRTAALLAALAVFNAFDLGFTHSQMMRTNFAEANPLLSGWVTGQSASSNLIMYKAAFFCVGAVVLYRFRSSEFAQASLWALTTFYAGLMVWWLLYLDAARACIADFAVVAPLVTY